MTDIGIFANQDTLKVPVILIVKPQTHYRYIFLDQDPGKSIYKLEKNKAFLSLKKNVEVLYQYQYWSVSVPVL